MLDLNTLAGALGGSILTIISKEILGQINKRQDFRRELKKVTYERKLEKAENAIAYHWAYINKLVTIKSSYELLIKSVREIDNSELDVNIILEILKKSGQALTELDSEKHSHINSIHLYFDLIDADQWSEGDFSEMMEALSRAKLIDDEILFWTDQNIAAEKKGNTKLAESYLQNSTELLPTYITALQRLINIIEKNKQASTSMMLNIKKQIEKY